MRKDLYVVETGDGIRLEGRTMAGRPFASVIPADLQYFVLVANLLDNHIARISQTLFSRFRWLFLGR